MLDTYMTFGGVEIANGERLRGYLRTTDCPSWMVKGNPCQTLREALGHESYDYSRIHESPWADSSALASHRFYGVEVISVTGMGEPSRKVSSVEGIADGQIFTGFRRGGMEAKIRASLFAADEEAMEYGVAWLAAVLDAGACGAVSEECGLAELEMFADCPDPRPDDPAQVEAWERATLRLRRRMIDAACISGPIEVDRSAVSSVVTRTVEFALASERGYIYGAPVDPFMFSSGSFAIEDVVRNLVPQPNAELSGATVVVAQNVVTNPSAELNTAGWVAAVGILSPQITRQSTHRAVGAWGFEVPSVSGPEAKPRSVASLPAAIPAGSSIIGGTVWVKLGNLPADYDGLDVFIWSGSTLLAAAAKITDRDALSAGVFVSIPPVPIQPGVSSAFLELRDTLPANPAAVSSQIWFDAASVTVS